MLFCCSYRIIDFTVQQTIDDFLVLDEGTFYTEHNRKYFVPNLSFCAASIRVSAEFNYQIVPSDGANLPRERCAAQQSNGYPRGLQATQKAHPKAAGNGT